MTKQIVCNKCGKIFDDWDTQEHFHIYEEYLGYGTIYDGCKLHMNLCCGCMESLIKSCRIDPIYELNEGET